MAMSDSAELIRTAFTEEEAKLLFAVLRGRVVVVPGAGGVRRRVEAKVYDVVKQFDAEYEDRAFDRAEDGG